MCLGASIYEAMQQKKAAKKAERQAEAATAAAAASDRYAEKVAGAQTAAEAVAPDAGETTELSAARRRKGVAATYLNQTLGE